MTRINKDIVFKYLMHISDIGLIYPVHQSEYGTHMFIIPKKEVTVRFIPYFSKTKPASGYKTKSYSYNRCVIHPNVLVV